MTKKTLKWIGIVLLASFVVALIIPTKKKEAKSEPEQFEKVKPVSETKADGWEYSSSVDKMDGDSTYFAEIKSTNVLHFNAPYGGGTTGSLVIRRTGKKSEVLFLISQGQILTSIANERTARIKFDDEKPITIGYSGTSDYDSKVIFLNSPGMLINKFKTANKVLFEVEYYNEGRQQFEFSVSGLNWN